MCEHAFVSIKGGSYQRFRRALEVGSPTLVRAAAAELPRIGLEDALAICLVLLDADRERFPAAAARRERLVGLPVHQELRARDVERIVRAVRQAIRT